MSADGTGLKRLAQSIEVMGAPAWSPDGRRLGVGGVDADGRALFIVPADGAPPTRLLAEEAISPIWSPDDLIVYAGAIEAGTAPLQAIRADGTKVPVTGVRARPGSYRFVPNRRAIVYIPESRAQSFQLYDFATHSSRPVATDLDNKLGRLRWFDITPDGTRIVFDRVRETSDVVLIELRKPAKN
jgi:Tol biopolymer transport system component